ncbi:MAG: flagellar basal-body rod protein FlgF [Aeromicrobium sp.]|nr:flagellar basal-body rod protein FlgF [Burkholderiales bacterium]
MDRMIYTAMAGARQLMVRQETLANNLANASTPGFRADLDAMRSMPLQGNVSKLDSRVSVSSTTTGADFRQGAIEVTGRDLDIAIAGDGFIAVEGRDGREGYTRNGGFDVGGDGILRTRSGLTVLGEGGPITVPENAKIEIGRDGTVSAFVAGNTKNGNSLGRIKLVNPPAETLAKGLDGLFRVNGNQTADADQNVRVVRGSIEASNVNVVESMVGMIALARQYEMTLKTISNAEANSRDSAKLLQPNG